jgi:hypothetical protein
MRIKITKPGLYNAKGDPIEVGTELDVKNEPKGWEGRYEAISSGKGSSGRTVVTNPAKYEAKHKGGGTYAIFDGDGKEAGKALSRDDAEAFNKMSDEDKAEFVKSEAA